MVAGASSPSAAGMQEAEREIRRWATFSRIGTLVRTDWERYSPHSFGSTFTAQASDKLAKDDLPRRYAQGSKRLVVRHDGWSSFRSSCDPLEPFPRRLLRRRPSPRIMSLRELRTKDSEAQLRSLYEAQTLAYLQDEIRPFRRAPLAGTTSDGPSKSLSEEDTNEEEDSEE